MEALNLAESKSEVGLFLLADQGQEGCPYSRAPWELRTATSMSQVRAVVVVVAHLAILRDPERKAMGQSN